MHYVKPFVVRYKFAVRNLKVGVLALVEPEQMQVGVQGSVVSSPSEVNGFGEYQREISFEKLISVSIMLHLNCSYQTVSCNLYYLYPARSWVCPLHITIALTALFITSLITKSNPQN